jgi:hypothetical protein
VRAGISVTAFIIISILSSIVWYLIVEYVLVKIDAIDKSFRIGDETPYLNFLVISGLSTFLALIIYETTTLIFFGKKTAIRLKIAVGLLGGLLPIGILTGYEFTYGLPLSDPWVLTELFILGLSGAFIPVVKMKLFHIIKNLE